MLEQKVWLTTSSPIFPNLYVMLISPPAGGKTRAIREARRLVLEIPEFHLAPISLTWASLVDALIRSKRMIVRLPQDPLEYNTMTLMPDEIGTFMHKWDNEMTDGLSSLYDADPYSQERRGGEIRVKIKSPQVSILSGATPVRLMELLPDTAWGQGITSRVIMVYSHEKMIIDDFEAPSQGLSPDLIHDLKHINSIVGEFKVTEDYRNLINLWRQQGEQPQPTHPRLEHYNSRRKINVYKLSMIAAINRGDVLLLTRDDFNTAMNWLVEAETYMADIFKAAAAGMDGQIMEDIYHFCLTGDMGKGIPEHRLVKYATDKLPLHNVMRMIELMERTQMIKIIGNDLRSGQRVFKAIPKA